MRVRSLSVLSPPPPYSEMSSGNSAGQPVYATGDPTSLLTLLLSNPLTYNSDDIISALWKDYFCPVEGAAVPVAIKLQMMLQCRLHPLPLILQCLLAPWTRLHTILF
jgi:hypothetical protein